MDSYRLQGRRRSIRGLWITENLCYKNSDFTVQSASETLYALQLFIILCGVNAVYAWVHDRHSITIAKDLFTWYNRLIFDLLLLAVLGQGNWMEWYSRLRADPEFYRSAHLCFELWPSAALLHAATDTDRRMPFQPSVACYKYKTKLEYNSF